jgi:hypothetical protein
MEVEFILNTMIAYIDEDDAVRSDGLDDWLITDESIYVEYGSYSNRGWWPDDGDYRYWSG